MAYANLSEALKSSAFETLSPEAKQHVFDKYSANDEAYKSLSAEAQTHVKEKYLGKAEAPKAPEKGMIDKGTEAVFGEGPAASMPVMERIKRVGEAGVTGMGVGGAIGGGVGALAGGVGAVPGAATGAIVGGVGGALGEIAEQATSALGGGRLLQVVSGLTASAPAEAFSKSIPAIMKNLAPSKVKYFLSGMESPETAAQKAATLAAGQEKQFGTKTPGYVAGQDLGTNAADTQARLQKEYKFGEPRAYAPSGVTTEEAVKPSTALSTGKEDFTVPSAPKRAQGYTEKLEPVGVREAKVDPKTGQPQKVSEVLRNEMYQEVGNVTVKNPSQRFSASPEFKTLSSKLDSLKQQGVITQADKNHLTNILKSDQGTLDSQQNYGRTVDRLIRSYAGKPNQTGQGALSNEAKNAVRNELRDTFSSWTEKRGFGKIEKDYRASFTQEKIAEAKDYIPRMLSEYDGKPEATQFARQMVNELPEAKELIKKDLKTYFANLDPKDIPSNLKRIDKLLVNTDIFKPEELSYLRQQVADVEKGGDPEAIGKRLKRVIEKQLKVKLPTQAVRSAIMGQTTDNQNQ